MPLPFIIAGLAAAAGVAGVGSGIHGAAKMKEANDTMKAAERKHKQNIEYFENESEKTNKRMDKLGELELKILNDLVNKTFFTKRGKDTKKECTLRMIYSGNNKYLLLLQAKRKIDSKITPEFYGKNSFRF